MSAQSTGQLLSNQDLADLMGWQVKTVHMRRYRGQSLPPAIIIGEGRGSTIRYRPEDVEQWLTEHRQVTDHDFDSRPIS